MKCWKITDESKITDQKVIRIGVNAHTLQEADEEEIEDGTYCQPRWKILLQNPEQKNKLVSISFDELIFRDKECVGVYHEGNIMLFEDYEKPQEKSDREKNTCRLIKWHTGVSKMQRPNQKAKEAQAAALKEKDPLERMAEDVVNRPAPAGCEEIARILSGLPMSGSLSTPSPTREQKKAFALLKEKMQAPTPEELRFMAEIHCAKYHRVRRDGDLRCWMPEKAEALYRRYYELTGSEDVKYVLDHFEAFIRLCSKNLSMRQRADDFELYRKDTSPSTSRDPDSSEWRN